jgi:hypothetical protein
MAAPEAQSSGSESEMCSTSSSHARSVACCSSAAAWELTALTRSSRPPTCKFFFARLLVEFARGALALTARLGYFSPSASVILKPCALQAREGIAHECQESVCYVKIIVPNKITHSLSLHTHYHNAAGFSDSDIGTRADLRSRKVKHAHGGVPRESLLYSLTLSPLHNLVGNLKNQCPRILTTAALSSSLFRICTLRCFAPRASVLCMDANCAGFKRSRV